MLFILLQCARMLDSETYKIALEDLESRLNLTGFENRTIGGEGFSFALMANHHKPQRPPSDNVDDHKNVDYGARRTVDKRGKCHAEHNAEKYFSTGKEERVPGFAHRPNKPNYAAYIDPDLEEGCAPQTEPKESTGDFPPNAREYRDQVLESARVAAREGKALKVDKRLKLKIIGVPAQANSFILFRRRNFSDWIKHGDPCPLLLAEVLAVNDKYDNEVTWLPTGRDGKKGPWRYYVTRWDLHRRTINKKTANFVLYKAPSKMHPAIIEKEKATDITTWYFLKEEIEELAKRKVGKYEHYGYSRCLLDFSSGDFVMLKQMAHFTDTGNLFACELRSLLKDPEFKKWYSDALFAADASKQSDAPSASAAAASVNSERTADDALQLCLLEAAENEMGQDEAGRFSENEDVEDWRFIQHARYRTEEEAYRAEGAREDQMDGYEYSDKVLALLDSSLPENIPEDNVPSSSAVAAAATVPSTVPAAAVAKKRGRPKKKD